MKAKMSKLFSAVLAFVVLVAMALPVYAAEENRVEDLPVPRWAHISTISAEIEETSTSGRYFVGADVHLYNAHYTAKIKSTLQKYSGGWKDTTHSWSGSGTAAAEATGYVTLSSGDYRIKIDVDVYSSSGGKIESITTYSSDKIIA